LIKIILENLKIVLLATLQTPILVFLGFLATSVIKEQLTPLVFKAGLIFILGLWIVSTIIITAVMSVFTFFKRRQTKMN
jgi:hypothetical protein